MRLTVAMLACAVAASVLPANALSNDELRIGISQEFETLNPIIMSMSATTYLLGFASRTLVSMNAQAKWYPQLAKAIPSLQNGQAKLSADKKHVIAVWELKDSAKWGDGQPITCADIDFTIKVAANNNISVPDKESYSQIQKVEWSPKNPKKCTFTYDKPRWDFYQLGTTYILPKHLEEAVYEKYKDQKEGYEKNTLYATDPTNPGLYSGPYLVEQVKLGSHVAFVPNPNFYGQLPKIKKIVVKLIPNTGTLEANLRSGTIDMISPLGLSFEEAIALDKKTKEENLPYTNLFKSSLTYEHIDLNLDNPILSDVRVRKALLYSINRDELVKALFENKQAVALHLMTKIDPWYTSDPKKITVYPYDKAEAAKLFDEAGWKLNPADGFRYKNGQKLELQFMTTAGDKTRETVQAFLQGQWKAAGVQIDIKNEPARVFFGDTTRKREFQAMVMYAWVSSPESNPKSMVHSSMIPVEANGWSGQNFMDWKNAKIDADTTKLETEFNSNRRKQLAYDILKYYTDDVPVLPLYYRADVATIPKKLKNYRLTGHQFYESNDAESWYVQ